MTAPHQHAPTDRSSGGPPPIKWQFGLAALFGTMLLLCIPFAIWGAILRADPDEQLALTLLCIAAPLGVMVIAAVAFSIGRAVHKLRRRRTDDG